MNKQNIELSRHWLKKAENDLITARQTLLLPEGPTDTVGFHAQQACEKALKALLTCHGKQCPKIHELVRLLDMAVENAPELEKYRKEFAEMSAYAIEVRYPTEEFELTCAEVTHALEIAEQVVKCIQNKVK